QGAGVPDADRERIFEKGVSTKTGTAHGYGLHLVSQFLNRWGGSVTVENLTTGGSRFTLYLPKRAHGGTSH
ncbi:ATP-binding protein, partial [Marinobacter alexandrii]